MPRTPRKAITDRKRTGQSMLAAAEIHGDGAADQMAEKLREDLRKDEKMPDIRMFFTLLRRRFARFLYAMIAAGQRHLDELADDARVRTAIQDTTLVLTRLYLKYRHIFIGAYGDEGAAAAGFESRLAEEPAAVELQTQRLLDNLTRPDLELPVPVSGGVAIQPSEVVETIRPHFERLRDARAALERERREAEASLLAKDAAVAAYDREVVELGRCFEANLTVAGRKDLAERFRPPVRRPSRPADDVEDEEAPDQEPGSAPVEPEIAEPPAGESASESPSDESASS